MSSKKTATALLTATLTFAATPAFALPAHGLGPDGGLLSGLARLWANGWGAVVEVFTPELKPTLSVAFEKNGAGMDPQGEPGTTTEPTEPIDPVVDGE
jgi:hypothetical protein